MNVDTEAILDHDLFCIACGYNLRGLSAVGNCPECGATVARSLQNPFLLGADWRKRVCFRAETLAWLVAVEMVLSATVVAIPLALPLMIVTLVVAVVFVFTARSGLPHHLRRWTWPAKLPLAIGLLLLPAALVSASWLWAGLALICAALMAAVSATTAQLCEACRAWEHARASALAAGLCGFAPVGLLVVGVSNAMGSAYFAGFGPIAVLLLLGYATFIGISLVINLFAASDVMRNREADPSADAAKQSDEQRDHEHTPPMRHIDGVD